MENVAHRQGFILKLVDLLLQLVDKLINGILRDLLHDDDVREVSAEALVITAGEKVLIDDFRRRTLEKHGIAALIDPVRPADLCELLIQIDCFFHHALRLLTPLIVADLLFMSFSSVLHNIAGGCL